MQQITLSKDIESRVEQFYKLKQETLCQGCKISYDVAEKLPKTLPCGCVQCLKCLEQQQEEKEDISCTVHKQEFSNIFRAEQLETDQAILQKMALLKVLSKYDKNQLESVSQLIEWKNQYIEELLHAKNEIVKQLIKNILSQQESLQSKYNEIMTSLKNQNYSNSLELQGFINFNELLSLIDNSFEFTLQEEIESMQSRQSITIYRFDNIAKGWPCTGRGLDCITFQTNINCRLVGIGLFTPDIKDSYSILAQFMVYEGKGSQDTLIYDHMVEIKQSTLDFLNPEVKIY